MKTTGVVNSKVIQTPYGRCDRATLEVLRNGFETQILLRIADELDGMGRELVDPNGLRADVLRLHAMAHSVINGAGMSIWKGTETLPELAADLETWLYDTEQSMRTMRLHISQLSALRAKDEGT
jgi:hypothetical protein